MGNLKELLLFIGFILISIIGMTVVYSKIENKKDVMFKNTLIIEENKEKIHVRADLDEKFTYGENKNYSVFRGEYFKELCYSSNKELLKDFYMIEKGTSPRYNNKELPIQYSLAKLSNEKYKLVNLKCSGFKWNDETKDLIYNKKAVRFLVDPEYLKNLE